ncbi:uncharacterized protein LOC124270302 [Haliotis rubra]|uniref:uncharacterized protein LOC124270302 n=1 Tax=Haliotis rubra TaxID=36100 RepID=UPI001EE56419|nr:uncharacterized protein LOC124270302 [Haliotis rubra]
MRIAMICSCRKRSLETNTPILDVERILQDYAWKDFKEKSRRVEKIFLRRRDFDVEVPMNYFHFEDTDTILKTKDSKPKTKAAAGQSISETSVLQTQFRNNTNKCQTYKFRTERTRKATISVSFQRGFSIGGKAQFKLGLPKMMSLGCDVDMRLQISKTTGETFEETLTFEANSDINVEENCDYTANVAFTEKEISAEFMVQTFMRMPTGTAPVYIRRKRDHELYATVFINDLKDVFADYKTSAEIIDESAVGANVAQYAIEFTTTGIVEGMRLSGQKIYLDSKKLDKGAISHQTVMTVLRKTLQMAPPCLRLRPLMLALTQAWRHNRFLRTRMRTFLTRRHLVLWERLLPNQVPENYPLRIRIRKQAKCH